MALPPSNATPDSIGSTEARSAPLQQFAQAAAEARLARAAGRVDDVINVSGHRIGTAEVEGALTQHEQCAEAAVVPMEHPIKGQGIYAFVTLMQARARAAPPARGTTRGSAAAFLLGCERRHARGAPGIMHAAPEAARSEHVDLMRAPAAAGRGAGCLVFRNPKPYTRSRTRRAPSTRRRRR